MGKVSCKFNRLKSKLKHFYSYCISTLELSAAESERFNRSRAPSPPDQSNTSIKDLESSQASIREIIMEPSINYALQNLQNIDEII